MKHDTFTRHTLSICPYCDLKLTVCQQQEVIGLRAENKRLKLALIDAEMECAVLRMALGIPALETSVTARIPACHPRGPSD